MSTKMYELCKNRHFAINKFQVNNLLLINKYEQTNKINKLTVPFPFETSTTHQNDSS